MPLESDKTVNLFDGETLLGWRPRIENKDHDWRVVESVALDPQDPKSFSVIPGTGVFYNGPSGRTSNLFTKYQHGDCLVHVEFVVPQGSNSGVYLMARYEVQILDSWGATDLRFGTCGGIYARWIDEQHVGGHAPRANAGRPPGEWQSYDVVFRAPQFDEGGGKVANACFVSVVWNGQLVHENAELEGHTRAATLTDEAPGGPLMLQGDHGPVAYRNIRLLELDQVQQRSQPVQPGVGSAVMPAPLQYWRCKTISR